MNRERLTHGMRSGEAGRGQQAEEDCSMHNESDHGGFAVPEGVEVGLKRAGSR
jgi:hypothetical protein